MFENLKNLLLTPLSFGSQKRFHEISKLGGSYSPFYPSTNEPTITEAYAWWVFTAVTSIAWGVAKLPFHLLNDSDKQIDHEYLKLINYSLLEGIASFLKLTWTVYIWKNTIGWKVRGLAILQTSCVTPEWDKTKTVVMRYKYELNWKTVYFKPDEMIVIMNFNPLEAYPYQTRGFSDIRASAISIDTDKAQSIWNWKEFENGAQPWMVLSTEWTLKPETIQRITDWWNNKFKWVNNAKKLAILEGGLKMEHATLNPKDMEYIEGKRMTRDEILAIFKVPKAVLWLGDGSWGNMNIRSYQEIFSRNAIEPVAIRIQDAFNKYLFAWIGYFEFYNIIPHDESIVRADYQGWIMTLNEARSMRWLKPVKWGDVFYLDAVGSSVQTQDPATPKSVDIVDDEDSTYKSMAWDIFEIMTKGSKMNGDLKIKKRDKRLTKYEVLIKNAVKSIADAQLKDVLSQVKEEKWLSMPNLNFKKYGSLWILKLMQIYVEMVDQEWKQAISEVSSSVVFKVWAPEVVKMIKDNIYLMSKSVDETTKDKLTKLFENGISEWIGASEMRDRITSEFETMKTSRAEAIARTETIRMSNEASIEWWSQSWVVESKKWFTSHDDRVSEICASLDGKVIGLKQNFFKKWDTLNIGDNSYKFDYSDTEWPPSHVNCRCSLIPVITQ